MRVHSKQSRDGNASGLIADHRLFIVDGINDFKLVPQGEHCGFKSF